MDLVEVFRLMLRRWPVVLPIVILTLLGGLYMTTNRSQLFATSGLQYLATVPGGSAGTSTERVEPFVAADSLSTLYDQPSLRAELVADGLSGDYTTALSSTGAVVRIEVNGSSRDIVQASAEHLVESATPLLERAFGAERAGSVSVSQLSPVTVDDAIENADGSYTVATSVVAYSGADKRVESISTEQPDDSYPPRTGELTRA